MAELWQVLFLCRTGSTGEVVIGNFSEINMKRTKILYGVVLSLFIICWSSANDDLEALKKVMGEIKGVKLEHKTTMVEAKENIPPRQNDQWNYSTGIKTLTINYSRFLNQPPHFSGRYPSLANSDMGVGFDGGSFGNWYRGNAIRVLVDGVDVMAEKPADEIEAGEGDRGYLRMVWALDKGGKIVLNFIVPEGGSGIYCRVDVVSGENVIKNIGVRLSCYPGGFAPAYGLPSHRYVVTAKGEWEVPKEQKGDFPVLPLDSGTDWIFYGDKLQSKGALGLLFDNKGLTSGRVRMSSYGQFTELDYPADIKSIYLAFYAFETDNSAAMELFKSSLNRENNKLKEIHKK